MGWVFSVKNLIVFLIALFSLFGFSFPVLGNELELGVRSYKNNENKKERQLYYHETRSYRNTSGVRITNRYKINRETGEKSSDRIKHGIIHSFALSTVMALSVSPALIDSFCFTETPR